MNYFPTMMMVSLILMIGSDCREREKPRRKWAETDGGIVFRTECREPYFNCVDECQQRQAGPACDRCCLDQDYLCEVQRPYDHSLCKGSR